MPATTPHTRALSFGACGLVLLHLTSPVWLPRVSALRWVCSFPVTRRLGYLWAAVSQAAPPIREEQARGHHLFIQPGPNDVWAGCAQFEARRVPSILLKVVSQGSHWMWASAGSGRTCCLRPALGLRMAIAPLALAFCCLDAALYET